MLDRLNEIKSGGYVTFEDDKIREVRSSVYDDIGDEIRNSNNTVQDIKSNQNLMKEIINKYAK